MPADSPQKTTHKTPTGRIVLASLIGTAIEFYDFYIYGTAAALVLGKLFFPAADAGAQSLAAFATFGIAFVARPVGSFLFGHFGDRKGRKSTLVWSLVVMGLSTTLIGCLPSYAQAGALAPALLCLLRLGQGIGLGGEWGGAALLATENAPKGKQALFGMFPQLGPPLGFLLSNGLFLLLFSVLTDAQFAAWGWRIPFLASALLVAVGLYVRRQVGETPAFASLAARAGQVRVPLGELLRHHGTNLVLGSLAMVVCYAIFYISTVFALDYGTRVAHIPRGVFLQVLCAGIVVMGIVTPVSAVLSDRFGCRPVLLAGSALAAASGFAMAPLLGMGTPGGAHGPRVRPDGRAAAEPVPGGGPLYRRVGGLQHRRHPGRVLGALCGAGAAAARRPVRRRALHQPGRRGELHGLDPDTPGLLGRRGPAGVRRAGLGRGIVLSSVPAGPGSALAHSSERHGV